MGTGNGLSRFDPGTNDWSRILYDSTSTEADNLIMWIHEDQVGNLWIGIFSDGLAGRAGTVAEVANAVGFKSTAYFSTAFRKHFGVSPSERVR